MLPWKRFLCTFAVFLLSVHLFAQGNEKKRPNILWITYEDCDPILGAYGDRLAQTPQMDQLAERGFRFSQAWTNSPVCAPSRTTLITGQYATTLGADHMRSLAPMNADEKLLPELLREGGYFCTNAQKEDYNLVLGRKVWDQSNKQAHWRQRSKSQPFFSVFNLGMTHESGLWSDVDISAIDLSQIEVPPYYPDVPEVRGALARQYANVKRVDEGVKRILDQLKEDGLEQDTIVFVFSDHGSGMPRHKRWLYAQGLRVPMIAYFPPSLESLSLGLRSETSRVCDRLISFVDMAPTMLSLTHTPIPKYMQGVAFAGEASSEPRRTHFAFRGRMDEVTDFSRSATDGRYLYIRNYQHETPQGETSSYQWQNQAVSAWKRSFDAGTLNAAQSAFWQPKSYEEFYDLEQDPFALNNTVSVTAHPKLIKLRGELDRHMVNTRDQGLIPEALRHSLSKGESLKGYFGDSKHFDAVETLQIAGAASALAFPEKLPFQTALKSEEAIRQYWGSLGLLRRLDVEKDGDAVSELLTHPQALVQVLAASKLLTSPQTQTRQSGIETLMRLASQVEVDYYVAFEALGALRKAPVGEIDWKTLETFQQKPVKVAQRVADFYPRQLRELMKLKPAL